MCRRHYGLTSDDSPKLHNVQLPWQGLRAKRNKCHKTYPSLLLQAFIYAQQGNLKILAEESPHFYILWIFLCEYQKWLVRQKGLEPPTYCLEGSCSIQLSYWRTHLERVMGIEPTRPAWKAGVLPLNYTRILPDQAFLVVFQAYCSINDIYYTTTRAFCQALFYIFFI